MKKAFSIVLAAILLLLMLTACGNGASTNSAPPADLPASANSPAPANSPDSANSPAPASSPAPADSPAPAAPADDGRTFILRSGSPTAMPNPQNIMLEEVQTRIQAATDRITVEVYHSGTLGTNVQMIQGMQTGSVEAAVFPVNWYEASVPEFGVLGLPGLFNSGDHAYEILSAEGSKVGELLGQYMEEKGLVMGAWMLQSDNKILSVRPINTYEDLKGLKIWCLPDSNVIATLTAMGMVPVNFDVGDLAVGLQQGTVDAAYTTLTLFQSQKLYESAPYYIDVSGFNFNVSSYVLSKAWMDSLPADLHDLVLKEVRAAGYETHRPYNIEYLDNAIKECVDNGMIIITPDEEFYSKGRAAVASLAEDFLKNTPSAQEVYDAIVQAIGR